MKVAVIGLWHLGCVTAACLASQHQVIAYDPDENIIADLRSNKPPIFEPGLTELIAKGQESNQLNFTASPIELAAAEVVWITFDTPVDEQDIADVEFVIQQTKAIFSHLQPHTLVLISSQLPVGTTRRLQYDCERQFPQKNITFAYSPENLRLGKAIDVFNHMDRAVIGLQIEADKTRLQTLFAPFTSQIVWMSIESAEMTKHALNAFLATSIVFINELAAICEQVGADARDVERGLKTEERIGPKAYLKPGGPIAGGTLARDVNFLASIANHHQVTTPLLASLLQSNDAHKQWSCQRVLTILKNLRDKTITTLGLTYKAGTDTLRRSSAIETCQWLCQQGAIVKAFDPAINQLPAELTQTIQLATHIDEALSGADAVIITTEWPAFHSLSVEQLLKQVKQPFIFDANGFLMKTLGQDDRIHYFSVGKSA